jgi:hypothetical protein
VTRPSIIAGALVLAWVVPATAGAERKRVDSTVDATIRNAPPALGSGYVVGNARVKSKVDILGREKGMVYGYIWGNFRHCGWVYESNLTKNPLSEPAKGKCSAGAAHHYSFRSFSNGQRNCQPGHCSNGSSAHVDYGASGCAATGQAGKAYANVNPFKVPADPHDLYGTLPDNSYVLWRYVTKDGNWVMVHDGHVKSRAGFPQTASDWYFVNRSCLKLS